MKRVITYGTFDLLHYGHINLLRRARELGDYLIVALSTDEFNWEEKHKKCYFSYEQRKQLLEAIRYVDLVIPEENWEQKAKDVKEYHIDTFVMGDDWAGKFDFLRDEGCEVVYFRRTPEISSSQIKQDLEENSVRRDNRVMEDMKKEYGKLNTNAQQIEIDLFKKNFLRFKDQRIVLYGIGRYTATLIPAINEFHIVGLMDRDAGNVGKNMYGIPIISVQEAEKYADLVIINTAETYWEVIYRRIRGIGIPVYYLNGENAAERDENSFQYQQNPYWNQNLEQLRQKIDRYEVISFDVFDTLVMRKVFIPQDIFKLVEKRIQIQLGLEIDFYRVRLEVDMLSSGKYMLLDDIYAELNQKWNLPQGRLDSVKQIEIETEVDCCVPREDMAALFNETLTKKTTYLLSDMYLPSEVIARILRKCGIVETSNLLISGEKKKDKKSGDLWAYFSQEVVKGRKALHIGDNLSNDIKVPQRYGIDTYYIMDSTMMWEKSSLHDFAPKIQSLEQSVFAGMLAAKIFNSPFALNKTKGHVCFSEFWMLGYCLWGGIIYAFLMWLVREAKSRKIDRLFFFARDGYLTIQDYNYLRTMQSSGGGVA